MTQAQNNTNTNTIIAAGTTAAAATQTRLVTAMLAAQANGQDLSTEEITKLGDQGRVTDARSASDDAVQDLLQVQRQQPAPEPAVAGQPLPKLNVVKVNGQTRYLTDAQVAELAAPATVMVMQQETAAPARRRAPVQEDYGDDEFGLNTVIGGVVVVAGVAAAGYLAYKAYQHITE